MIYQKPSLYTKLVTVSLFVLIASNTVIAQQTIKKYLSGTDKDHTVNWKFFCTAGRNSGAWNEIPVPSCWETQGYGTYHYGWSENYKQNETGLYQYAFQTDPAWKDKTVRLVFEGSMTDTEVKINGKSAGEIHHGSFNQFKYDITKLLKSSNVLEVKVDKISSDTSVNRAERMSDFWVFGGIHRPVYLEILPKQFIDWTAIDARADGTLSIHVYTKGASIATDVEAQITSLSGEPAGVSFHSKISKDGVTILTTKVDNPQLWNPESPQRYRVEVRLKNAKAVVHQVAEKFGFRTVVFREHDGFYVNDKRIVFKGVNRHTFWPTTGRTTSKEISIMDVNLIKDMNMNAVRMSHYSPEGHFLDVCDSLGLFVLDELTGWQKKYDTPVGRKLLKELVVKDVNHPSIIIWDNGNEGGNNHELVNDYALYDPQKRKVIHPWNIFNGTDTQHYKGYGCCAGSLYNGNDVFFPTEMLHGLQDGGHGAGLNDHWNLMRSNPLSAGAFLWVFADEGIVRHDKNNEIDVAGDKAPDGIVGPYREKEGSFYTIKEIWSPVIVKNESSRFSGTLSVQNDYLYTNLNQVTFEYKFVTLPLPGKSEINVVSTDKFYGPAIEPGKFGELKLPLPLTQAADVVYLKATDKTGREIYTWSWPLKTPAQILQAALTETSLDQANGTDDGKAITVKAKGVSIGIDKSTGVISDVRNSKGSISFRGGPMLSVGSGKVKSIRNFLNGNDYVVEVAEEGELKSVVYTMHGNGILQIDYAYSVYDMPGSKTFDYLGVNFNYPEEKVKGVQYAGRGPYRVWKNRMKGNQFGVWQKDYNNTVTGESWNYPEFKGYYRDFNWVVIQNTEQPFTIFTDNENMFLRLYTPEKPKVRNDNTTPPFPGGDISVMHAISAIGTKFDGADNHGPEGSKNKVGWNWLTGTLYFDFRVK